MQSSGVGLAFWSRMQASETGWGWVFMEGILCPEQGQVGKGILVCVVFSPVRTKLFLRVFFNDGQFLEV